jgi:ADP-heptose:LPS heptosyltransferase
VTATVLVLRALGLGDFVTGLPALQMVREALPAHRIVLAAPGELAPLVRLTGCADVLVHGRELEPLQGAPQRPDLAIDLHGNGPPSRALLLATHPGRLLAFNIDGMPRWIAGEHEVARWCRLVAEGLPAPDVARPGVRGMLPVPADVRMAPGCTVLHCGAKDAARRWPVERFAAIAIMLRAAGHEVVVTGGPDEQLVAHRIAAAAGVRAAGRLSLLQLLSLVAGARLVVCGDTGVAHVASAYGTPSVVLFGPVSPAVWGPPADPRHQVLWHGDGTGDPHGTAPDPALLQISVAEVAAACERAAAYHRAHAGAAGV